MVVDLLSNPFQAATLHTTKAIGGKVERFDGYLKHGSSYIIVIDRDTSTVAFFLMI